MEITPIPELPKPIVEAVNKNSLAVFIGAGVSRLIGCAGWDQLARNLVERCFKEKKKNSDKTCINFKEKEILLQEKNIKKVITICYHILKNNNYEEIFYDELKKSLEADQKLLEAKNIYQEIYRLRGLFITTNIDEHFDENYFEPTRIVYREEELNPNNIDRNQLYHIHGSIKDRNTIVFTVPQYVKRYNNQTFIEFLKKIFAKYTVLFIGYGLEEFELLDFLITKYDDSPHKELKHFILMPFYKGEGNILEFEQYYYNSMGIKVIPYEKDEKGYFQLYDVLRNWNSEINRLSVYLYNSYEELEKAANNYDKNKESKILQIIRDKNLEDLFFKKLAASPNPIPWLKPLKDKGYFDPQKNPEPQKVLDQDGYYIPRWNVLGFLENVASKNLNNPTDEVTNTLLDIIESMIDYRNKKRVDNYKTDFVIVKIIFLLPLDKITEKHIKFVETSLKSDWDSSLIAAEISERILPRLINETRLMNEKAKKLLLRLLKIMFSYKTREKRPESFF